MSNHRLEITREDGKQVVVETDDLEDLTIFIKAWLETEIDAEVIHKGP